jgi:hypothetical protein
MKRVIDDDGRETPRKRHRSRPIDYYGAAEVGVLSALLSPFILFAVEWSA